VIDGLHDNRFAFLLRLHHALMDGATAMQTLLPASTDPRERRTRPFFAIARPSRPRESAFTRFVQLPRRIAGGYKSANALVQAVGQTVTAIRSSPIPVIPTSDAPVTLINNPISSQRRVATQDFELARFRALARAAGGTVNDVFLAVCSGALRRYLLEFDALPEKSLVTAVPVALKRKEGDSSGNKLTAIITPLATQIADAKERFAAIRADVEKYKAVQQQLPEQTASLIAAIGLVPQIMDKLKGVRFKHKLMFNVTLSNVPGPREPRYFNGAEMRAMYPVSILFAGPALNMTLLGYKEGLFLGIVGAVSAPHVQRLALHARDAFDELEQVYGLHGSPPSPLAPRATTQGSTSRRSATRRASKRRSSGRALPRRRAPPAS
jgi:WS/DGAT/MGAT family acyltransferase